MIVVSPRSRLAETLACFRPSAAVSLRSPGAEAFDGFDLPEERVLHLVFNDIAEDRDGLVPPSREDAEQLIAFAKAWDRAGPLLIHCYAGISRSTAAALVIMAALAPDRDEGDLARELRALSPEATPNPYLTRLGDAALGREGRLMQAAEAIGRGAEAFEGRVFEWGM